LIFAIDSPPQIYCEFICIREGKNHVHSIACQSRLKKKNPEISTTSEFSLVRDKGLEVGDGCK